jgi:Plasmid pRiA4b ORF-3-like protein
MKGERQRDNTEMKYSLRPFRAATGDSGERSPRCGAALRSVLARGPVRAQGGRMAKTVHQLKTTIEGTKPSVWRRVVVPSEITFAGLHHVLQAAFGWWDCHMHEFRLGNVGYGPPISSTGSGSEGS